MESFSFFSINQPFFVCLYRLFSVLVYYSGPEGARVKVLPLFFVIVICVCCVLISCSVTKPKLVYKA